MWERFCTDHFLVVGKISKSLREISENSADLDRYANVKQVCVENHVDIFVSFFSNFGLFFIVEFVP